MVHRKQGKRKLNYKRMQFNTFNLSDFENGGEKCVDDIIKIKRVYHLSFPSPFKKGAPKDTIITYDVPTEYGTERDWFRRHLIKFGYIKIRTSVFAGPSPLPAPFVKYLKEIKINTYISVLKLAKPYSQNSDIL